MLAVFIIAIIAILLWFANDKLKCRKYPPGPTRFPIIGNIPQIAGASPLPATAFMKLAQKYGNVIYLRMGFKDCIVFNSLENVRAMLSHEYCQDRPQDVIPLVIERMCGQDLGFFWGNGKDYGIMRKFTVRTLRDFGFGKAAPMDLVVNEEASKFLSHLEQEMSSKGSIKDLPDMLRLTTTSFLWRFVTGVNYEMDDEGIKQLLQLNTDVTKSTNFGGDLSVAFPFLYEWFPTWMGKYEHRRMFGKLKDYIRETMERHKSSGDYEESPNCFVDVFLGKIEEENRTDKATDKVFTSDQLLMCLLDIFQAGADTTSGTLMWCILYMMEFQGIQQKVWREMEENLGRDEVITMATKSKLPFTYATVLECNRFSSVVPISLGREASQDFFFKGMLIKKKILLMGNLYSVHFDKDLWGDPENFRPERFLNKEGTAIEGKIAQRLIPFGYGQRFCLGASLAETTVFVYFAEIMRRFKVENGSGKGLDLEPLLGTTYGPKPYQAKFVKRMK